MIVYFHTSTYRNHQEEMDGVPRVGEHVFFDGKWREVVKVAWTRTDHTPYAPHIHMKLAPKKPTAKP